MVMIFGTGYSEKSKESRSGTYMDVCVYVWNLMILDVLIDHTCLRM